MALASTDLKRVSAYSMRLALPPLVAGALASSLLVGPLASLLSVGLPLAPTGWTPLLVSSAVRPRSPGWWWLVWAHWRGGGASACRPSPIGICRVARRLHRE
jgi:hypothetical protein